MMATCLCISCHDCLRNLIHCYYDKLFKKCFLSLFFFELEQKKEMLSELESRKKEMELTKKEMKVIFSFNNMSKHVLPP